MEKTVLLVVDVQTALVDAKPYRVEETIHSIQALLGACRENSVEVVYVQHENEPGEELERGSDGWRIYSEIAPQLGEKVVHKQYSSSFRRTDLKAYLDARGIERLIIVGMQTEYCIDATCKVAFEHGYHIIMPYGTNTTFDNGFMTGEKLHEYFNRHIFADRYAVVEDVETTLKRIRRK